MAIFEDSPHTVAKILPAVFDQICSTHVAAFFPGFFDATERSQSSGSRFLLVHACRDEVEHFQLGVKLEFHVEIHVQVLTTEQGSQVFQQGHLRVVTHSAEFWKLLPLRGSSPFLRAPAVCVPERQPTLKTTYTSWGLIDFADITRLSRSGDFICSQRFSKFRRGPFQRRSSTVSKTGTSTRRVARVRNNRASFHALNSDSDRKRASCRWIYRNRARHIEAAG